MDINAITPTITSETEPSPELLSWLPETEGGSCIRDFKQSFYSDTTMGIKLVRIYKEVCLFPGYLVELHSPLFYPRLSPAAFFRLWAGT